MSARVSLEQLLARLHSEARLTAEEAERAGAVAARLSAMQPWYVRAMVAFGAWLASFLLIGFVAGFSIAVGGFAIVGLVLIAGATVLRRQADNDFVIQGSLATSLAGQVLLAWGIVELGEGGRLETLCGVIIAANAVLFFVFPDRVHRVLSVLFAAGALTTLLYVRELNALVPLLAPALAATLVLVGRKRYALTAAGHGELVRPLENGLMLAAFGSVLLSTVYLLPAAGQFEFYPRPWISTVLLGALFLFVGASALRPVVEAAGRAGTFVAYAAMLALVGCAWLAPGIPLALTVALLGAARGRRTHAAAGIAFLAVFVAAYFYGMETTMLAKSVTLAATGAAVLAARTVLLRLVPAEPEELARE